MDRLQELEQRTHPKDGLKSAKGKDIAAFEALQLTGVLVEALAGWAFDHAAGLALEGLTFVHGVPRGMQDYAMYREAIDRVDDHRHERNGGLHKARLAPLERTRFWLNLLDASTCGLGWDASRSLHFDVQSRVYANTNPKQKNELSVLELQLKTLRFIEYYREFTGLQAKEAVGAIAVASKTVGLGYKDKTVTGWEAKVRKAFGPTYVEGQLFIARSVGAKHRQEKRPMSSAEAELRELQALWSVRGGRHAKPLPGERTVHHRENLAASHRKRHAKRDAAVKG
jgi:hypothetical protein